MVNGFTKFKAKFQGFENQYVIIGGTACDFNECFLSRQAPDRKRYKQKKY